MLFNEQLFKDFYNNFYKSPIKLMVTKNWDSGGFFTKAKLSGMVKIFRISNFPVLI